MNIISSSSRTVKDSRAFSTTRPHAHVISMNDNPCDYSSFDMRLVPSYTNNQLIYYFIISAISAADQAEFQWLIKNCKNFLQLLEWDSVSDDEALREISIIFINKDSDSDCPVSSANHKSIKINLLNISKLVYNSMIAQFNNWLVNLKTGFDEDSARFFTSHQKIILISIMLDEQLKIIFNSAVKDTLILSCYWWKFKNWLQEVILHEDSDKLKLSKEFTAAHQLLKKDLN